MVNNISYQNSPYSGSLWVINLWIANGVSFMMQVRRFIKYFFGIVGLTIAMICVLPIIPIFWLFLVYINSKTRKFNYKYLDFIISNETDYKVTKALQVKVKSIIANYNNMGNTLSRIWIFKGMGKQFLILSNSFQNLSNKIDKTFWEYDNIPKESNEFHLISEKTLWEKRTNAYEYWI